jgi:hypothetical protein
MPKRQKNVIWGIASLEAALAASMPMTPSSSGIQDKFTSKLSLKSEQQITHSSSNHKDKIRG